MNICSYNIRGLNSASKRSQVLYSLHKQKVGVIFFQETHFRSDHIPNLQNKYYTTWFHDFYGYSKSRGVSIAIHRTIPYQVIEEWRNRDGRAILLKLIIYGKKYTLINLYLPNQNQIKVGLQLISQLLGKAEGIVIVGGDFNFVMDSAIDTTTPTTAQGSKDKKKFKELLTKCQLVDIWRLMHPIEKNYTYYSNVHGSYHRIDFFLINQRGINNILTAEIGNSVWSDHAPVFLKIDLLLGENNRGNWRLNDNLLYDEGCATEIRKAIMDFINDHNGDTTSLPIQWEALKCVLRGLFIKHGARLKKQKNCRITQLFKAIESAETQHKQNLTRETLMIVTELKAELQTLLNEKTLYVRDKSRALFYQQGNKPGKLLARALKNRCSTLPIARIKTDAGEVRYDPEGILKEFQAFYTKLYNIPNCKMDSNPELVQQKIQQYIKETAIPTLTPMESCQLERDFFYGRNSNSN